MLQEVCRHDLLPAGVTARIIPAPPPPAMRTRTFHPRLPQINPEKRQNFFLTCAFQFLMLSLILEALFFCN